MKILFRLFFVFLFFSVAFQSKANDVEKKRKIEFVTSLNGIELRIAHLGFSGEFPAKKYRTAQNFFQFDESQFQILFVAKSEFMDEAGGDQLLQYKKWEQAYHTKPTLYKAFFKDVTECKNKEFKILSWDMKNPALTAYNSTVTAIDLGEIVLNITYHYSNDDEKKRAHEKMLFFCSSMKKA